MYTLAGVRPTGHLHVGHYFSVVKPALEDGATVLIAEYHAPGPDTKFFKAAMAEELNLLGINNVIEQSHLFNAKRFFELQALAPIGRLERNPTFKAEIDLEGKTEHLGSYPVLMTNDIMGFEKVYVGEDQLPHIELAEFLINRYNRAYGTEYPIPEFVVSKGRVMDLRNPTQKMSKSSPLGCLFLSDTAQVKRLKIRKAATTPEGLASLEMLYREFVGAEPPQENNEQLKHELAEEFIRKFEKLEGIFSKEEPHRYVIGQE